MFKDLTYVKDQTIFVSPDSCVSKKVTLIFKVTLGFNVARFLCLKEGYFEKEIFVGNPVVVIGVYYNPFTSKNSDFEPEIFCAQFRVRLM